MDKISQLVDCVRLAASPQSSSRKLFRRSSSARRSVYRSPRVTYQLIEELESHTPYPNNYVDFTYPPPTELLATPPVTRRRPSITSEQTPSPLWSDRPLSYESPPSYGQVAPEYNPYSPSSNKFNRKDWFSFYSWTPGDKNLRDQPPPGFESVYTFRYNPFGVSAPELDWLRPSVRRWSRSVHCNCSSMPRCSCFAFYRPDKSNIPPGLYPNFEDGENRKRFVEGDKSCEKKQGSLILGLPWHCSECNLRKEVERLYEKSHLYWRCGEPEDDRKDIHTYKVLVTGPSGSGKTSLLRRISGKQATESHWPTRVLDKVTRSFWVSETRKVNLELWDTPGGIQFEYTHPLHYRDAKALMVVFGPLTKLKEVESTFDKLNDSLLELDDITVYLVWNKIDEHVPYCVYSTKFNDFLKERNITSNRFVSAREGTHVFDLFNGLAESIEQGT